jgi:DNA-binding transcriptional LysR family regulator
VDLRTLRYFVAVVDERNFGRAAARLHMTQPPLTRAIRALEDEFGAELLVRTPTGASPTPAGTALADRVRRLLRDADRLHEVVAPFVGPSVVRIGVLADTAERVSDAALVAFRDEHPGIELRVREFDLTDPSTGLRSGETDVAMTRLPFDTTGLATRRLATEPIGVLARVDDIVATDGLGPRRRFPCRWGEARLGDLADRRWVRLRSGTDEAWLRYWTGGPANPQDPEVRTVQDCVRAVQLDDRLALAPIGQRVPDGLVIVPTPDRPPSTIVLAWRADSPPAIRSVARSLGAALLTGAARANGG